MKCRGLYVDRGQGILFKGNYDVTIGTFRTGFLGTKEETFYIPEDFRNIVIKKGAFPFFVVDAKSRMVLNYVQNPEDLEGMPIKYKDKDGNEQVIGINLTAKTDLTTALKLKVLIKTSFWEMLAKKLKIGLLTTLIYLGAGYGLFRFLEVLMSILFLHHT